MTPAMPKAKLDGLYLLLLGSVVFVLLGTVLANTSPVAMGDFRGLYYPARCLIHNCDPYMESEVAKVTHAEGGDRAWDAAHNSYFSRYIYFPPAFSVTVPIALLPWAPAHLLWTALTMTSLIFASFLIWSLAADYSPTLSGALAGLLLVSTESLVVLGNSAGVAIGLCVVGAWCFLRERFVAAGVVCLAVSLIIKPQDAGLVWLYFLLAGGVYRRRAIQTLLAVVALSLPSLLWVWHVSPHWIQEMHANVLAFSAPGGSMDPGVASSGVFGLGLLISLQTVFSFFRNDPHFYNPASYLVCLPLLLIWGAVTIRSRNSEAKHWMALASIAALSMLPVYHRQDDARLLLLAVPACAMLWAGGGMVGRLGLLVTSVAIVLTGDLPWAVLMGVIGALHLSGTGMVGRMLPALQVFLIPLTLLVAGVFYLCIYARRASENAPPQVF